MTRQLTITAAAWANQDAQGRLWLVGERTDEWTWLPPAEFVQACAPCGTCGGARWVDGNDLRIGWPCPDCRIKLVETCPNCRGTGRTEGGLCSSCDGCSTVILGHAYAVGQPLPIIRGWSRSDGDSSGDVLSVWKGHYGPDVVMQRAWNATAIQTQYADRTDRLAHYGPPESLIGKWAIELRVVGS